MGVCLRQPDCQGLQGASPSRVQTWEQGLDCAPHTEAEGSHRRPKQTQRHQGAPGTTPRPEEARRPGRPRSEASPGPSNIKPNWCRSETSGPRANPAAPSGPEQTRADLATGVGCLSPAAPRVLPPGSLDANENQERPSSTISEPSQARSPVTCHEHHEDSAAPLSRRDGRRNGALEPQHRSPQAQELARCVVAAVPQPAPPSSFSGLAARATTGFGRRLV